jgi:hypothetical protein
MAGILKVDTIQNANADNIITQTNSTTLTIGASGDTVTLAAGATSSGFGATYNGAVNWDTTPKTTTVTAVSGVGYFVDTTTTTLTVNLPAGTAGSIVAVSDYANISATNNIKITPNGTNKIDGVNGSYSLATNGASITFVYVDETRGWKDIGDATLNAVGVIPFITATGGTVTCCGNYKIHTFTGPGTFTVTNAGTPAGSNKVDYMVIAGGGSGGSSHGGGGGAGGYRESVPSPAAWTASPLASPGGALPVSVTSYPITVGAGGAAVLVDSGGGNPGNPSIFSTITSAGGGGGGGEGPSSPAADSGGSGGGAYNGAIGSGNTPPTSPSQGNNGGDDSHGPPNYGEGGGGGAGAVGVNGTPTVGGNGGAGVTSSINGTPTARAGGGGGTTYNGGTGGSGGTGGGGNGTRGGPGGTNGTAGTVNTGGGGGGGERSVPITSSFAGGSGIVIIRYKFQ